ncbi:uncharacterized protein LOC127751083 [Frankliniella occidentalis]|uniref:Uncharacterized protein LOC127751083 n=1 Tax=Frankliniella occidentalis TaxID=133901 RepID=A0A9C6X6H0_FRAOC|nr:uncharacterized protein LOC127751083 [Frankliniella occidentalis]
MTPPEPSSVCSVELGEPEPDPSSVCSVELGDPEPSSVCSVELVVGEPSSVENAGDVEDDPEIVSGKISTKNPFASFGDSDTRSILSDDEKKLLMAIHPIQPDSKTGVEIKLPFDKERVYTQGPGGNKRMWLSYCANRRRLFCWLCHAFGDTKSHYATVGWGDDAKWKARHCYKSIEKHELSVEHLAAVKAYLHFSERRSVLQVLNTKSLSLRAKQVADNREVVLRIINIVLFLAKQGIAFRGDKNEAAYTLHSSCNHGNFLEEVKSRAIFDPVLKAHLDKAIGMSQARHDAHSTSRGRGSLITFLSKNTFVNILEIITSMVLDKIREEVEENGGKFSFSMDGCQDISVKEQIATVLRYVNENGPVERFIDITALTSTSSEAMLNHAIKTLSDVVIMGNLTGFSFDGAGNMAGVKTGLQARLKEMVPDSIFQHCYSHVLNLALEKACNCILPSVAFFDLMRETATTISESYKRTDIWTNTQHM